MKTKRTKWVDKEKIFLLLFLVFTLGVLSTGVLSIYNINKYAQTIQSVTEERMKMTAKYASETITTSEELEKYHTVDDMLLPEYLDLRAKMQAFATQNDLVYVYFMRPTTETTQQMIIDSDPEEPLGLDFFEEKDQYTDSAFKGNAVCMQLGVYNYGWGGLIAAYAPIYNIGGEITAIVGVDIEDTAFVNLARQTTTSIMTSIVLTSGVVLLASVLFLMYRRKAKAYEAASIYKSQFLSRMSHEIRTPMNAIVGFSRMANNSENMDEIRGYLNHINTSSAFLLQLINNILDISKIEAGKMILNCEAHSPKEIMNNIRTILSNQAKDKRINFEIIVDSTLPDYIHCDKMYLTQVIVNLLSNALKFTPENGKVSAEVKVLDSSSSSVRLKFMVKDTGIGIKQDSLGAIFEAFEQAENITARKYGGTGLGLNIAQLLVGMMGGRIEVESKINEGSVFFFDAWFPITNASEAKKSENIKTVQKEININNLNILLVEDNEINQIIAANALEAFNANVDYANNGLEGLEGFIKNPTKYDLIIMDINMPIMDGYEATRKIRESDVSNAKTIPIIAMSANVFKEDIDASMDAGMNAHIGKPFDFEQLKEAIINVLSK